MGLSSGNPDSVFGHEQGLLKSSREHQLGRHFVTANVGLCSLLLWSSLSLVWFFSQFYASFMASFLPTLLSAVSRNDIEWIYCIIT